MKLENEGRFDCRDAYAVLSRGILKTGNAHFCRTTDLSAGFPRTCSMIFRGRELADPAKTSADCSFIGLTRPGQQRGSQWTVREITAEHFPAGLFDGEHIEVTVRYADSWSGAEYVRVLLIYPGQPFHSVRCEVVSPVLPTVYWNYRELRTEGNAFRNDPENLESRIDSLRLQRELHPAFSVEFFGRSDYTDTRVCRHEIPADGQCRGNLLVCSDTAGAGFCWLQEAPPSAERRDMEPYDFILRGSEAASCCWGVSPAEFECGKTYTSYRTAVIFFESPAEQTAHIKNYIRERFPIQPDKIISLVNPWGCGHFPEYVNPEFLNEDIKAAAECGADCYQIDDSWQQGESLGDLLRGRHASLDFWKISPKRMNGTFDPQIRTAAEAGIRPALWIAPSTNIELADWREFADLILAFHRQYGFRFFKLDGLMIRSYQAEKNMEQLLRKVRSESDGQIYFNLDTTNGQRPGFLLFLEYGNIFLENRYLRATTCPYHPEKTLRSLWNLSRYLCPERLQIEIPAPDDLSPEIAKDLNRPDRYPLEYWAAVALLASPLIWTAPSKVSGSTRAVLHRFMTLHRDIRSQLFTGNIYPIGREPSGKSFCGFYAESGFLLVFREIGAEEETMTLSGDFPECPYRHAELLAGRGTAAVHSGTFETTLHHAPDFALFRLSK